MNTPNTQNQRELGKLIGMVEQMRHHLSQPVRYGPESLDQLTVPCAGPGCNRRLPIGPELYINTGVRQALDPTCPECRKLLRDRARVVCVNCRPPHVVGRLTPGRDPRSGLVISADRVYHCNGCAVCQPGLERSQLLEQVIALGKQNKRV